MNRIVRLLGVSSLGLGLLTMNTAWGDDGALPRGKSPAPGQKLAIPEPVQVAEAPDCLNYLANPEAGEMLFSQDGKSVYFLSRQPGETGPEGKAFLYEADFESLRSKRIVSLKIGDNAALVGHGLPLEAITLLDFSKARIGCGEGVTAGIGIKWIGKQKIIKSYPQGSYKIVPSERAPVVADMDQKNIKMLDLNTFQKRTITSFPENFFPLYLRTVPLQLTGFKPEQNELVRYEGQDPEPTAVLKLKKGMRLVQDLDQFGIVTSSDDGKVLQVKQIKGWSGDAFRGIDIRLPEGFSADRVGVQIDFRSGLCLVQGANQAIKRELRQLMVHNGAKGQTDRLLKAPEGQYFGQAVFAQKGRKILMLSRSLQDDSVQSLRVGDPISGEWRDVVIARDAEKSGEKPDEKEKEKEKSATDKVEKEKDKEKEVEKPVRAEKKLPD
ncbi:MAG TPA: hypothetical protein VE954_42760 [Oligoflexus sp.]|uniref:hypothetical protein n=1 Tax=Oligoflexus sp. TaxID=1971216 RepID=UPI002D310FEC|nr:hypothetical protein [Oligoflexus sp.]HYX39864.1 hypothetical protein [Oligoflexus sp.]